MTKMYFKSGGLLRLGCALLLGMSSLAFAQQKGECPAVVHDFGPFDIRTAQSASVKAVESKHFTSDVEQLIKSKSGRSIGDDIDHTLRVFPNHPRALLAMMKLAERNKQQQPQGASVPVRCYFEEAVNLYHDDGRAHMLYGIFLLKQGAKDEGVKQLNLAEKFNDDSDPNIFYNIGLAYFDLKKYDISLLNAQKAYRLGFPLQGLKNKLVSVGQWKDISSAENDASEPVLERASTTLKSAQ